jgi:hypothetical protein
LGVRSENGRVAEKLRAWHPVITTVWWTPHCCVRVFVWKFCSVRRTWRAFGLEKVCGCVVCVPSFPQRCPPQRLSLPAPAFEWCGFLRLCALRALTRLHQRSVSVQCGGVLAATAVVQERGQGWRRVRALVSHLVSIHTHFHHRRGTSTIRSTRCVLRCAALC